MTAWSGVFGAPATPFGPDGEIDPVLVRRGVEFLVAQGVDGIALRYPTRAQT